jgi:prefoldin alpha subunit
MPGEQGGQQQMMQQYQQIQQQMEEIQEYLEQVDQSRENVESSIEAIQDLENVEEGDEILAPIGRGAFVTAEIKDTDNVVTNIGGDTYQKRENEEAADALGKEKEKLNETKEELQSNLQELQQQMQQMQMQMQQQQQEAQE